MPLLFQEYMVTSTIEKLGSANLEQIDREFGVRGSNDQQLHRLAEPRVLRQPSSCFRTVTPKYFRATGNADKRHTTSYYLIVHTISGTCKPLEVPVVSQGVWRGDQYFPGKQSYWGAFSRGWAITWRPVLCPHTGRKYSAGSGVVCFCFCFVGCGGV